MSERLRRKTTELPLTSSETNSPENFLAEVINRVSDFTETITTEVQQALENTTVSTGQTLDWIASNPVLKAADNIIGLDWLMTFLGKVDMAKIRATVEEMRSQYPQETKGEIAHRLIVEKAWSGGRLGLLTNIIPPVPVEGSTEITNVYDCLLH